MKINFFSLSIFLIIIGLLFEIIEIIFYQNIDINGELQESLFLPIGAICIFIGILLLICFISKYTFFDRLKNLY